MSLTALAFLHSTKLHTDILIQHDFIVATAIGNLKPFTSEKRRRLSDLWLAIIACSLLLSFIGRVVFNSWEAGIGSAALFISIIALRVMI